MVTWDHLAHRSFQHQQDYNTYCSTNTPAMPTANGTLLRVASRKDRDPSSGCCPVHGYVQGKCLRAGILHAQLYARVTHYTTILAVLTGNYRAAVNSTHWLPGRQAKSVRACTPARSDAPSDSRKPPHVQPIAHTRAHAAFVRGRPNQQQKSHCCCHTAMQPTTPSIMQPIAQCPHRTLVVPTAALSVY